jgi:hypothetical protein
MSRIPDPGVEVAVVPRLALSASEAAASIGLSRSFFERVVAPELRWITRGRRRFVAVAEIEDWLAQAGEIQPAAGQLDEDDELAIFTGRPLR